MRLITLLFPVAIILVSCSSSAKELSKFTDHPPLYGMIYDCDNRPVGNVSLYLNEKPAGTSDSSGRFFLNIKEYIDFTLIAKKNGYETVTMQVSYSAPTQVIYIKLITAGQLLALAEKEASLFHWAEALSYVDRSEFIKKENPFASYLRAVIFFRQKKYDDSLLLLESLLATGYKEPYIYLMAADILQYHKENKEEALKYLKFYADARYDPEVSNRIDALSKESSGQVDQKGTILPPVTQQY